MRIEYGIKSELGFPLQITMNSEICISCFRGSLQTVANNLQFLYFQHNSQFVGVFVSASASNSMIILSLFFFSSFLKKKETNPQIRCLNKAEEKNHNYRTHMSRLGKYEKQVKQTHNCDRVVEVSGLRVRAKVSAYSFAVRKYSPTK